MWARGGGDVIVVGFPFAFFQRGIVIARTEPSASMFRGQATWNQSWMSFAA